MEDLGLSLAEYSVFGSIMTIGAMLGAVLSGRIADILGRRGVPVYVAETRNNPQKSPRRICYCASVHDFIIVGTVVSWPTLALIAGTIPCLAQLISLFFIPESP